MHARALSTPAPPSNQAPGKSRLSIRASGFGKKEMKQSGEVHLHYVPNMGGQDFYPKPSGSGSHTAPPVPPIIAPSKGPTKKPSGVKVTVIEGYNLKGKDLIGKADPYCEVCVGDQKWKTAVCPTAHLPVHPVPVLLCPCVPLGRGGGVVLGRGSWFVYQRSP